MDPSPENDRAAGYQGPMTLEVVKSKSVQKSNIERQSLKIQIRSSFAWW